MPAATSTASMAVEHGAELGSIVASYLRRNGFTKTLSAFLRENGDTFQEMDVADLEILYNLYISTQVNGASKAKKARFTKSEIELATLEGDKDYRSDVEKSSANLYTNGGSPSEKKKKKKVDKKNVLVDLPLLEQTVKHADADEAKKSTKEDGSKKKKGRGNLESNERGLKSEDEKATFYGNANQSDSILKETHDVDGGCLATQQEPADSRKSSTKSNKIVKRARECLELQDKETSIVNEAKPADIAQVLPEDIDIPKKKRKKSKDSGDKEGTDDGAVENSVSEVLTSGHTEKVDSSKRPVNALKQSIESANGLEGGEMGSKKKRMKKELSTQHAEGGLKEPSECELVESKINDTGKKKKKKESVDAGKKSDQDFSNLGSSPEKLKGVEDVAVIDVEMRNSMSGDGKRKKETPNDKKTPTGALAFKRVEVEKVTFTDPRLSDNSYWAKDGADEGYGAKAQEVLGLVRGRDFRHEKTKKKRGSYRGGIIGLQSHSIKFENSDEE